MKSAFCLCILALVLLVTTIPLRADIARPKRLPQIEQNKAVLHTGLQIVPDAKASEARLQISEDTLKRLRVALNETPTSPSLAARIAHSSPRTIVAGLLLFLSVSFGGVWLARSSRSRPSILGRHQKAVIVVVLCIATLGAAAIITRGNAGPPSYYAWRNLPDALSHGRATQGGLDIEIIPESSGVKLIIPLKNKENGDE